MNASPLVFIATMLIGLQFCEAAPLDYMGAEAVLKQAETEKLKTTSGKVDSPANLRRDLKSFRTTAATLAPNDAAIRWIELADRLAKLSQGGLPYSYENEEDQLSFATLIESLPPPMAWDALTKATEARSAGKKAEAFNTILLRLTAHWLTGNITAQKTDLDGLSLIIHQTKGSSQKYANEALVGLKDSLLQNSDDGEAILSNLNQHLAIAREGNGFYSIQVPDLVTLVGEKKTAEFFRRVFNTDQVILSIREGKETKNLARKLALQMVDKIKTPQWSLAETLDSAPLFEAMSKRFPEKAHTNNNFKEAQTYYLLGLIVSHRVKDAVVQAQKTGDDDSISLPEDGLVQLEKAGHGQAGADFLHDFLEQNPASPFWDSYVKIAARIGEADKMLALAETASRRKGLNQKQQLKIVDILARAYLAADKVEDGVERLRYEIAELKKEGNSNTSSETYMSIDPGMTLAKLGAALGRMELVDEGLLSVRNSIPTSGPLANGDNRANTLNRIAVQLIACNRGPEAEAVLAEALSDLVQPEDARNFNPDAAQQSLLNLLGLYHRANRQADVIALLDHSKQWGVKDLSDIYEQTVTHGGNEDYVGYFAASALASEGRKKEALQIVNILLDQHGGYDPAYELLLQIAPEEASAKLDALFARDQFEERPLIWKAKLLLDSGKLEEAEKTARQAIAIDPTDGEEGPGRRLRAYAMLAEIREARGDHKEAAMLHEVLISVRNSDKADLTYEAGLVTRAMKMYEEALTHFADAYCIQARLAFRMAERGDMAGAEEHYRRAYELMPGSFGRVESYCFGCQGAFQGRQAQGIAEKVFIQLAAKNPEKPQIHYLLGYLFNEQNRYSDAMEEFRKAVKLDPDYLNAWKHLAEVSRTVRLPASERDAIQLNLLRLDPLELHSSFDFESISVPSVAWTALDAAAKSRIPVPETLYPLAASTEEIAQLQKNAAQHPNIQFSNFRHNRREDNSPGRKISQQALVQGIGFFFLNNEQFLRE